MVGFGDKPFPPPSPSSTPNPRRIAYFYDPDVGNYVYYLGHPMKPHRIRMAHNLIVNYGLCDEMDEPGLIPEGSRQINDEIVNGWNGDRDGEMAKTQGLTGARGKSMQVFRPRRADKGDMTKFHSDEYVDFLEKVTPETSEQMTGGGVRCLTGEDCPAYEGVFEFCSISAGGSIAAAEKLNSGAADIAINWAGGLHHAKKTEASGFCYINDIVLGILELLRIHPRVLYIDVDVHHGDGVEEAFYTTDRVMTASFHRFGEFFPGTGDVRDIGMKRGKGYAVNVPMRDGIRDESFHSIFKPIVSHIVDVYRPGAIVLQMGADSLAGDKLGGFNLTLQGHAECASFVKGFGLPVMMLGGGGYTTKNVARAWTYETAVMCDRELDENLPYNQYMEYYGPRYKLEVLPNNTDDHNVPDYLDAIKRTVLENLRNLPHAPGVQMQAVPSKRLGKEIGMKDGELSDPEDEVEARIRKIMKRRNMNGTYSPLSSDDESDGEGPSRQRGIRQGGRGVSQRTLEQARQRLSPASSSMDEDPCGVRRKRTFFHSRENTDTLKKQMGLSIQPASVGVQPTLVPPVGINGDVIMDSLNGLGNGLNGLGAMHGLSGMNGMNGVNGMRTEDVSRAGSPGSVV